MGAKRLLLIAGGTVGGLGAVLSITPPQFGSASTSTLGSKSGSSLGGATSTTTTPAPTQGQAAPAPTDTAAAAPAPSATKKSTKKSTKSTTTATTPAAPAKTTPAAPAAPVKAKPSGTFTGDTQQTRFGPVQVQITISSGKITAAKALQYPNNDFRSQQISQQAIPYLVQETLAAQSADIQGVGGASYTSQGWYDSLVSALAKAGM
jgi:uncharacterized protein with FMN-binding domain